MRLERLQIYNLRNIHNLTFTPHAHLNFVTGSNGSGKTSFLESIYLLGTGNSFRSRETVSLVSHGEDEVVLFAQLDGTSQISLAKSLSLPSTVKINSKSCQSSSELARLLPTQVFYQDIFHIIDAGPAVRRGVLDWGVFHVEHDYLHWLKEYKKTLKQRNALLRSQAPASQFAPWDKLLSDYGEKLHEYRLQYIRSLNSCFKQVLGHLSDLDISLNYYKGWDRKGDGNPLAMILKESLASDIKRQYTVYGAHNADLIFNVNELKAKNTLSRGQQKILLFSLKFAQTALLGGDCIYLIDDIHAELDKIHLERLLNYISTVEGQFFITFHTDDAAICHFINKIKAGNCYAYLDMDSVQGKI